ncbi:hypothetical protein GE061_012954, partial [Apolygus lucorum]
VFPQNERWWYFSKRSLIQPYFLHLKEVPSSDNEPNYEVSNIETDEYNSDGDEPLLSGTGEVSKDCTEVELESWSDVLGKWSINRTTRPKQVPALVKQGIPEALRGEVWQRLAKCDDSSVMDNYRILITKESNSYAVHDTEVGYCQGLSFLAATLLLHMPEEQAFCVLLKIMYDYGLRELYKDGFECLYLRLYQLNRLMEEHLPQLYQHFRDKGVETHMFASQWFLTLYTARFPLYFVFHIIDVFLLQGTETLFQVALALLTMCKKDLMQLDFESILKYFRVTLPKKCRHEEVARNLMKLAVSIKMKKLKKYEQEFLAFKVIADTCFSFSRFEKDEKKEERKDGKTKDRSKKKKKKDKHRRKSRRGEDGGSKRHSEHKSKRSDDPAKVERSRHRSRSQSKISSSHHSDVSRFRERRWGSRSRSRSLDRSHKRSHSPRSKRRRTSKEPDDLRSKLKWRKSSERDRSSDRRKRSKGSQERSRSRQEKDEYYIDKGKLLEIARKNALSMLRQGHVGGDANKVVHITAGGKTVDELTDFCKHLSRKEASGMESVSSDSSSDEGEKPFHHPFKLKERPSQIIMNIRNCVPLPPKTHQEKATEILRVQFPVSSGQHHRKTESEWVPVSPKRSETKSAPSTSKAKDTAAPLAIEAPPVVAGPVVPKYPTVYPTPAEKRAVDIGAVISERLAAIRKDYDPSPSSPVFSTRSWEAPLTSGLFTGSTGVKVLTPTELAAGQQAWARKDQLISATPVSGGMGMSLLQKMGWKPGEGLGKNHEGTLEPLRLPVKMDKKGLVCAEEMSWRQRQQQQGKAGPAKPFAAAVKAMEGKHPVSLLNEFCTRRKFKQPEFHTVKEDGPPHQKRFIIKVTVNGVDYQPSITSSTKKIAKSEAARVCLRSLGVLPNS